MRIREFLLSKRRVPLLTLPGVLVGSFLCTVCLAMFWRHLAGEDMNVARVWAYLASVGWAATLLPATLIGWGVGRWLCERFGFALAWTLAPTIICVGWLVIESGFQSPSRWALESRLDMYLGVDAPKSATAIRSSFGEAMGGCNEYFYFECDPVDTDKLILGMKLASVPNKADEPGIEAAPRDWPDVRVMPSRECYSRQDGAWTYCLWTDVAHRRVLVMMWC